MGDPGATFSRNFIATRHIYDVNDIVSKFPAEVGSQVICTRKQVKHVYQRLQLLNKILPAATVLKPISIKTTLPRITFFFNNKFDSLRYLNLCKYVPFEPLIFNLPFESTINLSDANTSLYILFSLKFKQLSSSNEKGMLR